jgi:hypothetical protein
MDEINGSNSGNKKMKRDLIIVLERTRGKEQEEEMWVRSYDEERRQGKEGRQRRRLPSCHHKTKS